MLKENLDKLFSEIQGGNNLGEKITLVGASKMVPVETINQAISLGLNIVAENKVQEFREKTSLICGGHQHFIGHLQSNKVKYLVGNVELIQSVDSFALATEISKQALKKNVVQDILVEINIAKEPQKSGVSPDSALEIITEIAKLPSIKVKGIMTVLPKCEENEKIANFCLQMRGIFDTLKKEGLKLEYLSMGMSEDYLIAIKNGSNMIRLGTAIFGKRNYGVNQNGCV